MGTPQPVARPRKFEVKDGSDRSVCPNCGIWRVNAGYTDATCGPHFRTPGCFVKAATKE